MSFQLLKHDCSSEREQKNLKPNKDFRFFKVLHINVIWKSDKRNIIPSNKTVNSKAIPIYSLDISCFCKSFNHLFSVFGIDFYTFPKSSTEEMTVEPSHKCKSQSI